MRRYFRIVALVLAFIFLAPTAVFADCQSQRDQCYANLKNDQAACGTSFDDQAAQCRARAQDRYESCVNSCQD